MTHDERLGSDEGRFNKLTEREADVLGLLLEGISTRAVASALFCSKRTVDFHITKIYQKLHVNNRVQAIRRAAVLGLVDLEAVSPPRRSRIV